MNRYGIIGYPVAHSRSPELFREAYGGRYPYDIIETPDFDEAWDRFVRDYRAVNVTMPFKEKAAVRAIGLADAEGRPELIGPEVRRIGAANILKMTPEGIAARNSDYLGVRLLLGKLESVRSIAVIGFGGAGKAAEAAAEDCGLDVKVYRHDGISAGVKADLIIYTLPEKVEGTDRLDCRLLLEANYKDPCLTAHPGYIPGTEWLKAQAATGYELMTGHRNREEFKISLSF